LGRTNCAQSRPIATRADRPEGEAAIPAPLELRHLKRGHDVHFTVPHGNEILHLDLLGKPPRAGSFAAAWPDATLVPWRGLSVRIVDARRLVDTKKTNRDQDYIAIQRLAEMVFNQVRRDSQKRARALEWLLRELRTPRHLKTVARKWEGAQAALGSILRPAALLAARNAGLAEIQAALDEEKAKYQQANLDYWKPLLHEPRGIRRQTIRENRRSKQK
jgi:hypothetical protein